MVVPREHGAWGMLLVPLATGAAVASGTAFHPWPLVLFMVAALALFWLRTPVEAWLGTSAIKVHSSSELNAVLKVAILLAAVATAAITALFVEGYSRGLLAIGAVAALSFALQAGVKRIGRRGRMPAQIIGAVGLTSTAASAFYVATHQLNDIAIALWLTNWLFAGNQVHFVQLRIHAGRAASVRDKLRQGYAFLAGQTVLLIAVIVLSRSGILPKFAVLAFVPAMLRGTLWFLLGHQPLDVHKLGFSELFQSILFGALLCLVFLV
jgi:hypothetical protein